MKIDYEKFLIDPSVKIDERTALSDAEAKGDIQFVIEALQKAYPAKWVMAPTEWDKIIDHLQNLTFPDKVPITSFGEAIADVLWSIPDGHLKIRHKGLTCGSSYRKNLRQPSTGRNLANIEAKEFWKLEWRKSPRGNIPVLAISGFPQSSEPSWNGFTEMIQDILKSSCLIVDLRGNNGGDDTKAIELVSTLLGHDLSFSWVREVFCETAEAYALQINTYERIIWNNYLVSKEAPPRELVAQLNEIKMKAKDLSLNPRKDAKLVRESDPNDSRYDGVPQFNSDIFVLIDPTTVSSGEWTALYLKKHPKTKIIGENTYGMIHFGNTGYLELPNSKLAISLCMKVNEFTDRSFYEKSGVPPDITISGEDTLEYTLSNLIV
jgi:hypothetical protein